MESAITEALSADGPLTVTELVEKITTSKELKATKKSVLTALKSKPAQFSQTGDEWSLTKYVPVFGALPKR